MHSGLLGGADPDAERDCDHTGHEADADRLAEENRAEQCRGNGAHGNRIGHARRRRTLEREDPEVKADSAGKVITLTGTCDCPVENRPKTMKTVITIVDNDHHTMEGFDVTDGKETKTMTIKYTRSKERAAKE